MSRKIFGIDISHRAVTAVAVKSRIKGNWIDDHASIPISGEGNFDDETARALEMITSQMDISGAVCIAALPAAFVSFRNLMIPFKEKKKIRQILPFELETTLPYAPEDVVADFNLLDFKDGREASSILAAAVEKHRLESFLNLLRTYGIEPDIVTVSGFAVSQCLNRFTEEAKNQLLLSIDENQTTMTLNQAGQVVLVRSFAGRATDEAGVRSIMTRVRQTLSALEENMATPNEIDDVRLSGSISRDPFVAGTIEKMLGVPATPLDLMTHSGMISLDSTGKQWNASNMDAALSLALAEISGLEVLNFRQGRFAVQKAWVEHKKDIVKTGILAVVIGVLFLTNIVVDYYSLKNRSERVQKEIVEIFRSTFPDVTKIVDPLHQMRLKLKDIRNSDLYPEAGERSIMAIDILNDISKSIPDKINVALNSIIIGSDSILISGDTDTFNAVNDMKSRLEDAEAFKTVSISSANMDKSGDKVHFKLKVSI
jgi:general secretion pathway protein L